MIHFYSLEKGPGKVSPPDFVNILSKKMLPILYYINRPYFIVWLSLLFEILANVCITICFLGYNVIDFEINIIFLIKPFLYMSKKSRQKFKYLVNEILPSRSQMKKENELNGLIN